MALLQGIQGREAGNGGNRITEERYTELTDKYLRQILEALDRQRIPFHEDLAAAIGDSICACVLEAGTPQPFEYEVARLEQRIDTTSLDGACHWYWKVIAGFTDPEAAEEYRAALSDESTVYAVLQGGRPDDFTLQGLNELLDPEA